MAVVNEDGLVGQVRLALDGGAVEALCAVALLAGCSSPQAAPTQLAQGQREILTRWSSVALHGLLPSSSCEGGALECGAEFGEWQTHRLLLALQRSGALEAFAAAEALCRRKKSQEAAMACLRELDRLTAWGGGAG
jgi:hypothetical protein